MTFEFTAQKRDAQGTGASRRLRRAAQLPAVVYGADKEAVSIVLEHNPLFFALQKEAFHTEVIDLVIDGQKEQVRVCAFQMHPYKAQVMHIDFKRV